MSKRALKAWVESLSKSQLEQELLDLYSRFKPVKTYYDFSFQPNESQLLEQAKVRISKEYNLNLKRPKARRSVAQKLIKHFMSLQVSPEVIGDLMLFNIEIAQLFAAERNPKQEAFYKSMLNSFEDATKWVVQHELVTDFQIRLEAIADETLDQHWPNYLGFERVLLKLPQN